MPEKSCSCAATVGDAAVAARFHRPVSDYAGLNLTNVRSGVTSSKHTVTGMPTLTLSGAASMFVVIRTPSSSSTIAST